MDNGMELRVKDYCAFCPDFEADVDKMDITVLADHTQRALTTIRCEHAEKCERIYGRRVESARSKDAAIAGKYKTTSNLYLRVGAGTGKTAITLMPAGSSVQCYGYYTTYNGTRWYYVVYGDKTGFCSSAYLQKA